MKLGIITVLMLVGCSGANITTVEVDAGTTSDAGQDTGSGTGSSSGSGSSSKPYDGCTETCDGICTCPNDAMNCVSLCGEPGVRHCMPYIPNGEGCPSGYDCKNNRCTPVEPVLPACGWSCNEQCACPGIQSCQQYCGGVWLCEDPGHLIDGCPVGYACINPEGCIKDGTRL